MAVSTPMIEDELRVSPRPVIALMVAMGVVLVYIRNPQAEHPFVQLYSLLLGLLLWLGAAVASVLHGWNSQACRCFIVGLLVAAVALAGRWLGLPGTLALLAIPTCLAAALMGVPAAAATALGETVLVFLLAGQGRAGTDWAAAGVGLVAIWVMLAAMLAVYHPVHQFANWSWEYYERAQRQLEEARERKAALAQALDDLAHANRQLALTNERMTALRLIAEDARKAKSRFVSRVSHEFRAPLNIIIGLVGLMVENPDAYVEELPPDLGKDLEIVHRNCQHLASMIGDVLDLTQAEADLLVLRRERASLAGIVESALAVVRPLAERKQLGLQVSLAEDLPEVDCDPVRIRQVVLNLLSNAARFTDQGTISVHAGREGQQVVVSVSDTGPGIPPEDAQRVFEPFYMASRDLPRTRGGSGLGLSISKQFIELHGGRIWLESELGKGTTFYCRLPVSSPAKPVARPGHWIREDWIWRERGLPGDEAVSAMQPGKPRVIVCDDTDALFARFMRYADTVEFVHAPDLARAAQELQQCPAHAMVLNVAAADDLLPLVETASRDAPGTAIIGCSVPQGMERVLQAGAAGYLVKPVTRAGLDEALRAAGRPVRRVLVADDDPDFLSVIARMLKATDGALEVTAVSGAEEVLAEARRTSPDLILLDIVMPGMNGWELLELLRREGQTENAAVFFVSAQELADQAPASQFLLAATNGGLSINKLLRCSLGFSAILLEPERELDQAPV